MKFGKQILAQQIPGWSQYYLDYKGLKKIVSSLASGRPGAEAAALALGARPADGLIELPVVDNIASPVLERGNSDELQDDQSLSLLSATSQDEDRGPDFQAHKTAFFFRLERELEKINSFYLQKEAELKLRLETLLSKRMAAAARLLPDAGDTTPKDHVEWKAVEEGFRLLERDLAKLQQFVDINAIGFRKILKKWDKRSKSTTKELYLSRQVEVQPVFNRQLISELSDVVTQCLLDLTDVKIGLGGEDSVVNDLILTHQLVLERSSHVGPYHDLETKLQNAVKAKDERAIREHIRQADVLYEQQDGKTHVMRILWRVIIDAPPNLADLILASLAIPFDFHFVDDINGRTCLHEAAMSGELRLVDICIQKSIQLDRADVYGRTALHYSSMNSHGSVCRKLITAGLKSSSLDMDNYTPLMHAILKGNTDCVLILLDEGHADVGPPSATNDLNPLALACRVGRIEVVELLLRHGARSTPNTNGEYPIHIAAQEGHPDICQLLINYDGWDKPDKYNEWTPLFHAARNGHESCVRILLELGSRANVGDETGKQAVFYAAWYGHPKCIDLLLEAAARLSVSGPQATASPYITPSLEANIMSEVDVDMIPSLSLPPPIMPYRVYGHNFLDKACLIHVSVGHPFSLMSQRTAAVDLSPRIMGPSTAHYPLASPLFKLVMTCKPDITAAPYSVSVPIRDERDFFTFQTTNLDDMSLEFSIYPNFGTKTIGRAVALPTMLQDLKTKPTFVLPILDHHLHMIGEVSFEVRIITPFKGVTLEIGGAVETYWKSLASPFSALPQKPPSRMAQAFRTVGSTQTSPSNYSISGSGGHTITLSSLIGDYVQLTIQVTRDLHPIVFNQWKLPVADFDLGVSDVTLAQVQNISSRAGHSVDLRKYHSASPSEWHQILSGTLFSLRQIMKALPPSLGIYLDLAFPSSNLRKRLTLGHGHVLDLNSFVDAVLKAVYNSSPLQPRRRIVLGSCSPDVCAALNWKQPNYPVFLASECGIRSSNPSSPTAFSPADVDDRRLSSISASVDWAKTNNLLGVFLDADLLMKVPSLIQGVKDVGLLLGVYEQREQTVPLSKSTNPDATLVDAFSLDGVVSFLDHSSHGFI